jgi:hypothetical protein
VGQFGILPRILTELCHAERSEASRKYFDRWTFRGKSNTDSSLRSE